jgi:hypothetical protein
MFIEFQILFYVDGKTSFFPVHIHYISDYYSLPVLFIVLWKVLVWSKFFTAYRAYVPSSYFPSPLSVLAFLFVF